MGRECVLLMGGPDGGLLGRHQVAVMGLARGALAGFGVLVAAGAVAFSGAPYAAAVPTPTPPANPVMTVVTGNAANGVQVSLTAPQQMPVEVDSSSYHPREFSATVKDVGGQGYTGPVSWSFAVELKSGGGAFTVGIEHFDAGTQSWRTVQTPPGQQTTMTFTDQVTVPAGGQVVDRFRATPGLNYVDDFKITAAANGSTATSAVPVTRPKLDVTGLPGSIRAGQPYAITGTLTNVTDVDYTGVDIDFFLQACGAGQCVPAKNLKLEIQKSGVWKPVTMTDTVQEPGADSYPLKNVTLAHGAAVQIPLRVTIPANAPAGTQLAISFGPQQLSVTSPSESATLLPAQVPSTATRSSASATPTPTPSQSSPSASDSPTPSPSDSGASAPSPSGSTTSLAPNSAVAATPSPSNSSNSATILVAAGLLAVCLALVLWYFLRKRRGRV